MGIVYKATNKIDGTSYIGATRQSLRRRRNSHHASRQHYEMPFVWALREYGRESFEWSVLREVPDDLLFAAETNEIRSARSRGERLYNVHDGQGPLGLTWSLSAEARARIGARHKGKIVSSETRAKLSMANKGNLPPNAGRPQPAEVRAKISASLKGRPAPKKPKPVFEGKSYNEWAAELGVTYSTVWRRIQNNGTPFLQPKEQQNGQPEQ